MSCAASASRLTTPRTTTNPAATGGQQGSRRGYRVRRRIEADETMNLDGVLQATGAAETMAPGLCFVAAGEPELRA
jgi:hypothetical protein